MMLPLQSWTISRQLKFGSWQDNSTFEVAILTAQLEVEFLLKYYSE